MSLSNPNLQKSIERFFAEHGRRPRILIVPAKSSGLKKAVAKMATTFADIGFDVDIGPPFLSVQETVRQAIENDVHIICLIGSGKRKICKELLDKLKKQGQNILMIVYNPTAVEDVFLHNLIVIYSIQEVAVLAESLLVKLKSE